MESDTILFLYLMSQNQKVRKSKAVVTSPVFFIENAKIRKKLQRLVSEGLSTDVYILLTSDLKKKKYNGLYEFFLEHSCEEGKKTKIPCLFHEFLKQLFLNNPVCGVFQVAGDSKCLKLIEEIIRDGLDIRQNLSKAHILKPN